MRTNGIISVPSREQLRLWDMYLKLELWLYIPYFLPFQASRAGRVGAEEHEAEGETPPVSVPGPDLLGEPGRPAGHRQADRCNREAGQGSPYLHQRSWNQSHHNERVMRVKWSRAIDYLISKCMTWEQVKRAQFYSGILEKMKQN